MVAGGVFTLLYNNPLTGVLVLIALFAVIVPSFAHARGAIRASKRRENWYGGLRQTVAVDTSLRTRPEPVRWTWAIPAVALLIGTVVLGIVRYPAMPETLTLHYDLHGQPDRVASKSIPSTFGLVLVQADQHGKPAPHRTFRGDHRHRGRGAATAALSHPGPRSGFRGVAQR